MPPGMMRQAGSIDDAAGTFDGKLGSDGRDFVAVDAHVGEASIGGRYDRAVADYGCVKTHFCSSGTDSR